MTKDNYVSSGLLVLLETLLCCNFSALPAVQREQPGKQCKDGGDEARKGERRGRASLLPERSARARRPGTHGRQPAGPPAATSTTTSTCMACLPAPASHWRRVRH